VQFLKKKLFSFCCRRDMQKRSFGLDAQAWL
jgi:hypothetical protein